MLVTLLHALAAQDAKTRRRVAVHRRRRRHRAARGARRDERRTVKQARRRRRRADGARHRAGRGAGRASTSCSSTRRRLRADRASRKIEKQLDQLVEKGKLTAAARDATMRASARRQAARDLAELRRRGRGGDRERGAQARDLQEPRRGRARTTRSSRRTRRRSRSRRSARPSSRPDRVIGMHFMNPVPLMKLVEIVRGLPTERRDLRDRRARSRKRLGKTTVGARDIPGFIVNRILIPLLNEACFGALRGARHRGGHRHRRQARPQPPDGPARARRPDRPRHRASRSPRCCTASSATTSTGRARCSASTSPPAGSAEDRPRLLRLRRRRARRR